MPADAGTVHRDLAVITVDQHRELTMTELRAALEASKPGLVRAKGRLAIDGRQHLVQLTPDSIDITEPSPGPAPITLISIEPEDAARFVDLIDPPQAAKTVPSNQPR
jgi:hypothetical protein